MQQRDVYKRQDILVERICHRRPVIAQVQDAVAYIIDLYHRKRSARFPSVPYPVSYTHLDVYKRQG